MAFFGLVHVYWALGGTAALPAGFSVRDDLRLLVVDLVAVPLCGIGAVLAVALGRVPRIAGGAGPRPPRSPGPTLARPVRRRALLALGWATTALLVVHALPATVVLAGLALGLIDGELTERDRLSLFVYEPYWLLGGVLFGLATAVAHGRAVVRGR
jgi:hypothetical protein